MCSGLQGKQVQTVLPSSYLGKAHYHTFLSKARPIQTALFWHDSLLHEMAAKSPFKCTLIV